MKEIELLKEQIKKLNNKDFDLEAWKQYTIILLARIFGEDNQKIRQIEKIEYDYSSWSLRDTSGKSSYLDTCKKLGKEILVAAIDELNVLGLPEKKADKTGMVDPSVILSALEGEMKVSELRKTIAIINEATDPEEKRKKLKEVCAGHDKDFYSNALLSILSHPGLSDKLDL